MVEIQTGDYGLNVSQNERLCIETVGTPYGICADNGCIARGGRCVAVDTDDDGIRDTCRCIATVVPRRLPSPKIPERGPVLVRNQPEFQQVQTQQGECPSFTGGLTYGAGFVIGATAVTATVVGLYKLLKK